MHQATDRVTGHQPTDHHRLAGSRGAVVHLGVGHRIEGERGLADRAAAADRAIRDVVIVGVILGIAACQGYIADGVRLCTEISRSIYATTCGHGNQVAVDNGRA